MPPSKEPIFDLKRRRVRRPADAGVPMAEPEPMPEPEFETPEPDEEPEPALPLAERLNMPQVLALGMLNRAQEALVVGAGPWAVREWAEALTARTRGVTVVDADKKLLAQARSFCKSAIAAAYDRPDWTGKLGGLRFDVVLVGEALSHLPDPVGFLRQVREILTPDGVVVAIVPNVAHGEKRLELLTGEFPRDFEPVPTCHHYTRTRVRELFAFSGYGMVEVQEFEKPLFEDGGTLVPELFPAPLLRAIALDEDLATSHFVVKAAPSSPEALLRGLFDEQAALKRAVRNELAKATRTHDALTERLKDADARSEGLVQQLADAHRHQSVLREANDRAEQETRRVAQEALALREELAAVKETWLYRLLALFGRKPEATPHLEPANWSQEFWQVDEEAHPL